MKRRIVLALAAAAAVLGLAFGTYYDMAPTRAPAAPVAGTYYDMVPAHH